MSSLREKLHLRLTAIALVVAVGLPLLLHERADLPDAPGLAAHCRATVLASEDLGSRGSITVVVWRCPPAPSTDRWTDALQ